MPLAGTTEFFKHLILLCYYQRLVRDTNKSTNKQSEHRPPRLLGHLLDEVVVQRLAGLVGLYDRRRTIRLERLHPRLLVGEVYPISCAVSRWQRSRKVRPFQTV